MFIDKFKLIILFCLIVIVKSVNGQHGKNQIRLTAIIKQDVSIHQELDTLVLIKLKSPLSLSDINKFRAKQIYSGTQYVLPISQAKKITREDHWVRVNSLWKASESLLNIFNKSSTNDFINVKVFKSNSAHLTNYLSKYEIKTSNSEYNMLSIRLAKNKLLGLLNREDIIFADLEQIANEEVITSGIHTSDISINAVRQKFPALDGSGVNILLKEGQFDINDIDLLGKSVDEKISNETTTNHATLMATTILGLGNSHISSLGVSPGAKLSTTSFSNLLPENIQKLQSKNISVQNNSYGTVLENYYGIEAYAYDKQVFDYDTIVNVFSSGNLGQSIGGGTYSNVRQFGTLSGNFKQAKNIIVVGAVSRDNTIEMLSSRGPSFDGRVKPDIVSSGQDGTSSAAALTSGVVALIKQKYRENTKKNASAALVKSILLNSAQDLGIPQVDYIYGYGKLDAYESVNAVDESRILEFFLKPGQEIVFPIRVNIGDNGIKATLVWTDPPGRVGSFKSIVNHLDLSLEMPSGEIVLPWVLNSFPNKDSLSLHAIRKRDELNNVQQVSANNIPPGEYKLRVKGREISQENQSAAITFKFNKSNSFTWLFPCKGDYIISNQDNYLRWQSTYDKSGVISISYDNGLTWVKLVSTIDIARNYLNFHAPKKSTTALLKMESEGKTFLSEQFVISPNPTIALGFDCNDSILLKWSSFVGASNYTINNLKNNRMEPIATVYDSILVIDKKSITSPYFSVVANFKDFSTQSSYTIDYRESALNCYTASFDGRVRDNKVALKLELGSGYKLNNIKWEKEVSTGRFQTFSVSKVSANKTSYDCFDNLNKTGIQKYRAVLVTIDGQELTTNIIAVNFIKEGDFVLFPNPVESLLIVNTIIPFKYTIGIFDTLGRTIFTETIQGNKAIDLSKIVSGVYIYIIYVDGKEVKKSKFIKL